MLIGNGAQADHKADIMRDVVKIDGYSSKKANYVSIENDGSNPNATDIILARWINID